MWEGLGACVAGSKLSLLPQYVLQKVHPCPILLDESPEAQLTTPVDDQWSWAGITCSC